MVHGLQIVEHDPPLGVVVVHFDLLADNALLFADGFLCKVRGLYKIQQNFQGLVNLARGGEQVVGGVKGSKGVGAGASLGKTVERVALLAFKELVLQIVGNSLGYQFRLGFISALKTVVNGTVAGAKHGVRCAAALFGV